MAWRRGTRDDPPLDPERAEQLRRQFRKVQRPQPEPAPDPDPEQLPGAPGGNPGRRRPPEPEPVPRPAEPEWADRPTTILRAGAPQGFDGFLALPHYLVASGVWGAFERQGLGGLVLVLMRRAEMRDTAVTASWRTLCREAGIGKQETLAARLMRLTTAWETTVDGLPVTIPALLDTPRRATGQGRRPRRWTFRAEGLEALGRAARDVLQARAARAEALRTVRRQAAVQGAAARWGRAPMPKQAPTGRFGTNLRETEARMPKRPPRAKR